MSAKRRNRKIQSKRSKSDVDPYTERYRKSSDAAKAARDAARRREGASEDREVVDVREEDVFFGIDISQATLRSVSLVPEGQGFPGSRIEVVDKLNRDVVSLKGLVPNVRYEGFAQGNFHGELGEPVPFSYTASDVRIAQEGLRAEAASDGTSSLASRGSEGVEGQPSAESSTEPQEWFAPEAQAGDIIQWIAEARQRAEEEYRRGHWVFFEAEVNGLPKHIGTTTCYCPLGANHWKELGEI